MDATLEKVEIEGADVRGGDDCYTAGFIGWCNDESVPDMKHPVVRLQNCALRNSKIIGRGTAAGLVGHVAASENGESVILIVTDCEVVNNTIVCTEEGKNNKAGAVVATVAAEGATVSAKVSGNKVYSGKGSLDDTDDTTWKTGTEITTVYGRRSGSGTLSLTGGTYDHAPIADADAAWAKLAEWSKFDEKDGVFKVVNNLATLGNVKARQRYPWNGLVDVTFELKSKNEARVFIVAEYVDGGETKRLPMAAAKLVNDDKSESDVDVSTGFTVSAQATAKTVHVIWNSTAAVPTRLSGVTFKVYAK